MCLNWALAAIREIGKYCLRRRSFANATARWNHVPGRCNWPCERSRPQMLHAACRNRDARRFSIRTIAHTINSRVLVIDIFTYVKYTKYTKYR